MNKSFITLLLAVLLLAAVSVPMFATQASAERAADKQTVQGVLANASAKAGTIADNINATKANISHTVDIISIGNKKLDYYDQVLSKSELLIANMSRAGIDTSGMESVVAGARSSIVSPLESAVASGDSAQVSNELKTKCLLNGTSYSYHYGAKMDLETLKATTKKIEKIVTKAGYGTQIEEVNTHLANAESALASVGTNPYTKDQKEYIYGELQSASVILADIIKSMNGQAASQ